MDVTVDVDAKPTIGQLTALASNADQRVRAIVRHHGFMLQAQVMAHASGRPGPRAVTGDYRRSIALNIGSSADGTITATVGTNKLQARRLEFGFVGVDSLGRHYFNPPLPHFRPAFGKVSADFLDALTRIVDVAR